MTTPLSTNLLYYLPRQSPHGPTNLSTIPTNIPTVRTPARMCYVLPGAYELRAAHMLLVYTTYAKVITKEHFSNGYSPCRGRPYTELLKRCLKSNVLYNYAPDYTLLSSVLLSPWSVFAIRL